MATNTTSVERSLEAATRHSRTVLETKHAVKRQADKKEKVRKSEMSDTKPAEFIANEN